ncbi:MAG: hypothetical protein KDK22_11510, partial [Rhodobacteraceae bacterium]|nr:hypothetical protein [Paracoccaceae bacterium]
MDDGCRQATLTSPSPSALQGDSAADVVIAALGVLLRATPEGLDTAIVDALGMAARATAAARGFVVLHSGAGWSISHEWCSPGIEPTRDHVQAMAIDAL